MAQNPKLNLKTATLVEEVGRRPDQWYGDNVVEVWKGEDGKHYRLTYNNCVRDGRLAGTVELVEPRPATKWEAV